MSKQRNEGLQDDYIRAPRGVFSDSQSRSRVAALLRISSSSVIARLTTTAIRISASIPPIRTLGRTWTHLTSRSTTRDDQRRLSVRMTFRPSVSS